MKYMPGMYKNKNVYLGYSIGEDYDKCVNYY